MKKETVTHFMLAAIAVVSLFSSGCENPMMISLLGEKGGNANGIVTFTTITFHANYAGNASTATQQIPEKTTAALNANTFARTGYSFAGWATTTTGSVAYANNAAYTAGAGTATVNLYAVWTANTCAITFNANGGTGGPANATATYGQPLPEITTKPTRDAYYFAGYFDAQTGGAQYYGADLAPTKDKWDKASDTTLYAQWTTTPIHTIIFRSNDGTSKTETQQIPENTTVALNANTFARTGYSFDGWATTAAGTVEYADSENYTAGAGLATVNLYAQWTANTYIITFNANGGTGGPSTETATYDAAMPAISTAPTRTGYTFTGYYDAETGGTQYYTSALASAKNWDKTSDATLYAQWTAIGYTITFNANGGTGGPSTATATYGAAMPTPGGSAPTRTGYIFTGYYDAETGGTQYYTNTLSSAKNWDKTSGATLYAQWTANTYNVTFNANGGTGGPADVTATYDAAMPAISPAPTRTGYTFTGYFDAETGGTKYYNSDLTSAKNWDKTYAQLLYAQWDLAPLTSLAAVAAYLASASGGASAADPIPLPVSIALGDMTSSSDGWQELLSAIENAGKYVALDLSACAMSGTEFNPVSSVTDGKDKIVSLTLPDAAESIAGGSGFNGFTALTGVSGGEVTGIGYEAFYNCASLESVFFPKAASIDVFAFARCTSLKSVSFPEAATIGGYAFDRCTSLKSVSFPKAASIDQYAFADCTSLESASFPEATSIGNAAFNNCNSLTSITISAGLTNFGNYHSARFDAFSTYYLDPAGGNQQAGTYTWNGSAWTGPTP
uniref:Internalin-like protein (LPXTG motif) n=1 Tax=uncultured bacterium contig00053 TaxID=1181537 RepID=A0A806JY80_9BACT|nr:internalin-like protein (LPXTG motif) [uncultured bacterium contig00053]